MRAAPRAATRADDANGKIVNLQNDRKRMEDFPAARLSYREYVMHLAMALSMI
jgi:hypothetical protein